LHVYNYPSFMFLQNFYSIYILLIFITNPSQMKNYFVDIL
jgi:hypothetical protein